MARLVGIVGKFTHEGITTALKARDLDATHVNLYRVSVKTWERRIELIKTHREGGRLAGLVLHLPSAMIIEGSKQRFRELWAELLDEAALTKAIAFIYADNLARSFRPIEPDTGLPMSDDALKKMAEESKHMGYSHWQWRYEAAVEAEARSDEISAFINAIYERNIPISPFYKRDDVTIRLNDFLDEVDNNIFLRIYVPNSRFQAEQLESLLRTFERYLHQLEDRKFRIESRTSGSGTLYVFCTETDERYEGLEEAFSRFDHFMKMCRDDPNQAISMLSCRQFTDFDARLLVTKYARDFQRILIDVKHEFQQKMLCLSHSFDLETLNISEQQSLIASSEARPSTLLDISGNTGTISLNIVSGQGANAGQIFDRFSQEVGGNATSKEENEILRLISENADRIKAIQLRSDYDQARANDVPEAEKRVARGQISSFLFEVSSKIGEEILKRSVNDLSQYVMTRLGVG